MEARKTLWHINWGDGDDFYVVALTKEAAINAMPEGKDMVNYVVKLDSVATALYKAGQDSRLKEVKEWLDGRLGISQAGILTTNIDFIEWQAFLKGLEGDK